MLLSALQHIFAGLKRTRDQKLSSGLMSGQLSSAITGLMLLTFTTTHLLTSRPTLRSRSPCASWAPPLHWGLVRGSFPAPHHHDPNETLPNFAFWVMVAAHSCQTVQHSDGDSLRRSLSSPFRAILGSLAVLLPYLAKGLVILCFSSHPAYSSCTRSPTLVCHCLVQGRNSDVIAEHHMFCWSYVAAACDLASYAWGCVGGSLHK